MNRAVMPKRNRVEGDGPPEGGNPQAARIVEAAYFLIAEKGFEGLRTRDVAEKVGMNIATLHYYFPSKEEMIQGVVTYLMQELRTSRITVKASASALERLRAEFQDIRVRLRESPHQLVVLTELAVRSLRDPKIARILQYLDQGWRGHLILIFDAGVKDKSFRSDLNVESAATAVMTQLRGLGFQGILEADKIDQLVSTISVQTEEWIRAQHRKNTHEQNPKKRKLKQ
jgi:AcrR family transcriptional regulator